MSWVAAVLGTVSVSFIIYSSGNSSEYYVYWVVMATLTVACAITGATWGKAGFIIFIPCFILLATASYYTVPPSGFGGIDMRVAFWHSIAFSFLSAVGAMLMQGKRVKKTFLVVIGVQVILMAFTVASLYYKYMAGS